ncbi:DUF6414 family protein [Pantoea vagans]|uniref:DUF6414 family protein n=1 Tax=Pantoea vagans TaxID=470934 RepID=UPI0028AA05D5|nr:hypothetical protein [Pantoea vagans]
MSLKNIIYIDYDKVYSLSAQLFEGLVHSATQQNEISLDNAEAIEVKGQSKSTGEADKRSLSTVINPHDYHYLKFEKEIESQGQVLSIDTENINISDLLNSRFVKIKAKINLIDYSRLKYTTKNFNRIGYAINYVSHNNDLSNIDELIKSTNGPNRKKLNDARASILKEITEKSMIQQKEFLGYLSEIFDYGYGDDVEITQKVGALSATSFFIKDFFKIPLEMFIKRYSRKTIKEFTIVGTVTQVFREAEQEDENNEKGNMRIAARTMSDALYDVESTFCTPLPGEIFIEPIALYTDV